MEFILQFTEQKERAFAMGVQHGPEVKGGLAGCEINAHLIPVSAK